jgi:glycosyltransferase involved in cell wall biosynthesis
VTGLYAFRAFVRDGLLSIAHQTHLSRLRCEALLRGWRPGIPKSRVMTTACFSFPIYSQTFVYREVAELARGGFEVRFVYSELASKAKPTGAALLIWRLRRKLILSDGIAARDMRHYVRRMPERVASLVRLIAESSGLTPNEIKAHRHFRQAFSFTRAADCWKAEYLHSYFFYERTLFALVASHLLDIPRGVSCYADHVLEDYALKLVPMHMRTCAVAVATSARIKGELETIAGQPLADAIVKPNAIDVLQFKANRRPPMDAERPIRIVTVCRIHPKKGLTYLVDAVKRLRDSGLKVVAQIVGEPDNDAASEACFQALQQQIATCRLETIVALEGRKNTDEVREYLAGADIFVAPFIELPNGDKDGIPTALLEAMAAGCAIVTTDAGSMREVVDHEREGLIVPQRDAAALADAVLRLVREQDLADRISRGATLRAHRQFDSNNAEEVFHAHVRAALRRS